jgi:hypothetical protein
MLSIAPSLIALAPGAALAHVTFSGLGLYYARGVGVALGGGGNVDVRVQGVRSALHGHSGVALGGTGVVLRDSEVFGTGCAASTVYGGDLRTLTRSGLLVANNSMHHYARIERTYNPGIGWFGTVGGSFVGNTLAHAPHNGMLGGGALNLFEGNVFDTLLYEATDSGAFYTGRSWTQRGNVVRGNTFRRIRATEATTRGYPSVQAIYLGAQGGGGAMQRTQHAGLSTPILTQPRAHSSPLFLLQTTSSPAMYLRITCARILQLASLWVAVGM